jgi:ribose-phosphate pyrophosphokinase
MILFNTEKYKYLADELPHKKGNLVRKKFDDGEHYIRIDTKLEDEDVYILGGTISDHDTMDIYDLACACVMYGAKSLHLVIPYFGYSTMERAVKGGEVVKAKTRARLLSSIPKATEGNYIHLFDVHSEGIVHYFEDGLKSRMMSSDSLFSDIIKQYPEAVLASPDAGRAKTVETLASKFNRDVALVLKRRDGNKISHTAINADVEGKNVIIYDDMIRSGNTLIAAAKAYKSNGAKRIIVLSSHGLFTNHKLLDTELIEHFYVTNSHPNSNIKHDKLTIISMKELI